MRVTAGLLWIVAGVALASSAGAETASGATSGVSGASALFQAAFAGSSAPPTPLAFSQGAVAISTPSLTASATHSGAFVLPGPDSMIADPAPSRTFIRRWPEAFKVSAGGYDLALSPHAGVGVGDDSSSAEAGATVSLGARIRDRVINELDRVGVREADSEALKDRGRWFLFASASGSAVGLNIARDASGHYQRLGWSAEGASALISDAQAGVAWRNGVTQASLGYVRRDIHADFGDGVASNHFSDSMVAFSLSIHP